MKAQKDENGIPGERAALINVRFSAQTAQEDNTNGPQSSFYFYT